MGKTLERDAEKEVHVADVVRHGDKLIVPEQMKLAQAIDLLHRRMKYEEETVELNETFDAFPWDGAHALEAVLVEMFGWAPSETRPGSFFQPPQPPQLITVEVGPGLVKQVAWGMFSLPTVDGLLTCTVGQKDGGIRFALEATVKRKDESTIKNIFALVRAELKANSIYRGKAIKLRFRDDSGKPLPMPEPKFINTAEIDETMLIYSRDIERSIQTNLFTPIERVQDCIANGIPVKRGIMLGGSYGTGKTLAARVASKKAVDNGLTFVCVLRADELDDAINFAKLYSSPATVLFCEDIDRALAGERTVRIDDILNTIDGIDSKNQNLITVLTSNHLDDVNPAMLRPGRLDAIIEVTAPDAEATARLIRLYAGKALEPDVDITSAAERLASVGTIPAVIAEVVKRAKLSQLAMSERGTLVTNLSAEALDDAAFTMRTQNELLARAIAPKDPKPMLDQVLGKIIRDNAGDQRISAEVAFPNGSKGQVEGRVAAVQ
jgi:transitional endoplasmic reticulum ATPase